MAAPRTLWHDGEEGSPDFKMPTTTKKSRLQKVSAFNTAVRSRGFEGFFFFFGGFLLQRVSPAPDPSVGSMWIQVQAAASEARLVVVLVVVVVVGLSVVSGCAAAAKRDGRERERQREREGAVFACVAG